MFFLKKIFYIILDKMGIQKRRLALPIFRYNVYSQDGDDGIIEFVIGKMVNTPCFVVDIGANDGITNSNSRLLIEKYHFKALLVEPFEEVFKNLKILYSNCPEIILSNHAVGEKSLSKEGGGYINWHGHFDRVLFDIVDVNSLFEKYGIPKDIGFLSIDTDGRDNVILQKIDWKKYSPWFVIAEIDSSSHRNLQEQIAIMDIAGYFPVCHIGNVFYCRKDLSGEFLFNWRSNLRGEYGFFLKEK